MDVYAAGRPHLRIANYGKIHNQSYLLKQRFEDAEVMVSFGHITVYVNSTRPGHIHNTKLDFLKNEHF